MGLTDEEKSQTRSSEEFNFEKDSLHLLPLEIIPLQSPALSRARLVKNVRMEGMVEVFRGQGTGSGQVDPVTLEQVFDIAQDERITDADKIRSLCGLTSFDVYSLRIQLRTLGIDVDDIENLRLSKEKRSQLTRYMVGFTRPLIRQIYGDAETSISDVSELIALFDNPNRDEALKNLKLITENLRIGIGDLPRFLEDYGDTFLSLAYFRDALDALEPKLESFFSAIELIRENHQLRQNATLMRTMDALERDFASIKATVEGHFAAFDQQTSAMWENMTAESFHQLKSMIESSHTTVGGILCGLSVKLGAWHDKFGGREAGLIGQAEFIMSDMRQGMDLLLEISVPPVALPSAAGTGNGESDDEGVVLL
ncbi:MAG: hypothetical protein OXR03_29925 [Rhodospirillaceae bacterium]|nr:hypothetical protein [Rhodospirillaceae bacterium]MDD9930068.1 hypothetical protein [Rhodospirillaceae bacterium]